MTATSNIEIEWLSDSNDCDQAGCSGGYATGAIVKLNGETILNLIPVARCWDSDSWDMYEVYRQVLMKLTGYTVEELYG